MNENLPDDLVAQRVAAALNAEVDGLFPDHGERRVGGAIGVAAARRAP